MNFTSWTLAALLLYGVICIIYKKVEPAERRFVLSVLGISMAIKFIAMIAYYHFWLLPGNLDIIGPDGEGYSQLGWYLSNVMSGTVSHYAPSNEWVFHRYPVLVDYYNGRLIPYTESAIGLFTYIVGVIYYLFGYVPLLIKSINIIITALSSLVLYRLALEIYNKRIAKTVLLVFTFFPTVFIFSIAALRDPAINLCIIVILYVLTKQLKAHVYFRHLISLSACLVLLLLLRAETFVLMAGVISLILLFNKAVKFKILLISAIVAFALLVNYSGFFPHITLRNIALANIAPRVLWRNVVTYIMGGNLRYKVFPDKYYDIHDKYVNEDKYFKSPDKIKPFELVKSLPRAVLYYFLRPFPFVCRGAIYNLISLYMLWWYTVLLFAAIGILRSDLTRIYPIILYIAAVLILSSMLEANAGTLIRHRDAISSFFILFASAGIDRMSSRPRS